LSDFTLSDLNVKPAPTALTALRIVSVERLRLQASIGILPHELTAKQPLVVSMRVWTHGAPLMPTRDDVGEVLDYRKMRQTALDLAARGHINMLETFVGEIATKLAAIPSVQEVHVKVEKPNVFPDCDGAVVEVRHVKP
jgi:7,8-dihydroneopterin aldolase/epimerase/oxygenase